MVSKQHDGRLAWSIGSRVDMSNFERLRGFCDGQTDERTFAILESLSRLKTSL